MYLLSWYDLDGYKLKGFFYISWGGVCLYMYFFVNGFICFNRFNSLEVVLFVYLILFKDFKVIKIVIFNY